MFNFQEVDITKILASCPKLETLIYTQHIMVSKEKLISVDDLRLVYMQENSRHLEEWLTGTRGEMDFWACADAFVAKRRCDEIEPRRCILSPALF
jgi:hypothetical protein